MIQLVLLHAFNTPNETCHDPQTIIVYQSCPYKSPAKTTYSPFLSMRNTNALPLHYIRPICAPFHVVCPHHRRALLPVHLMSSPAVHLLVFLMSDALALPLLLAFSLLPLSCVGLSIPTACLQHHLRAAEGNDTRGKRQILCGWVKQTNSCMLMVAHSWIVNRMVMYKAEFMGARFYHWNIVLSRERR